MFAMPSLGGMRTYGHDLEFGMPYPVDLDHVLVSGADHSETREKGGTQTARANAASEPKEF